MIWKIFSQTRKCIASWSDHDGISHHIHRNTSISLPLYILFNNSWSWCISPDSCSWLHEYHPLRREINPWRRTTDISPLDALQRCSNEFCTTVKVFFLNRNTLMHRYQSEFLTGHCIVHQLIEIHLSIMNFYIWTC